MTHFATRYPSRAIAVAAVLAAALSAGAKADEHTSSNDGYRFVRTPIVLFRPLSSKVEYIVYTRLNRAVPRLANGSPLAGAHVNDYGLDLPPAPGSESGWGLATGGNKIHHCYTESFLNVLTPLPGSLRNPRAGRPVKVAVYISGRARPVTATAHMERFRSRGTEPRTDPYLRRLGCVHT